MASRRAARSSRRLSSMHTEIPARLELRHVARAGQLPRVEGSGRLGGAAPVLLHDPPGDNHPGAAISRDGAYPAASSSAAAWRSLSVRPDASLHIVRPFAARPVITPAAVEGELKR